MRWGGLLGLACVLSACGGAQAFACAEDSQCMLGGEPGVCFDGSCAYPDPTCPSGYRFPISLGGSCAAGDGVGGTDSEASTSTASTTSPTTASTSDGSEGSSTTQTVEPTSDVASITSSAEDTGPVATTLESSDATSSTGGPPQSCGDQGCSGCASCVMEGSGDCSEQVEACSAVDGCATAAACMIDCAVDDVCLENCCLELGQEGIEALFDLYACAAEVCVSACQLFEVPPCR